MTEEYKKALNLYGIKSGFVDEQLKERCKQLLQIYCSNEEKLQEIKNSYNILNDHFRHYIISGEIKYEHTLEEILKIINLYISKNKPVDEKFIISIVEILVPSKDLLEYAKEVEFLGTGVCDAQYVDCSIKIYMQTLIKELKIVRFLDISDMEKIYYSYFKTVITIIHEIEHVSQKKFVTEESDDVRTIVIKNSDYYSSNPINIEEIINLPVSLMMCKISFLYFENMIKNRKYRKYWCYDPSERVAEIAGYNSGIRLLKKEEKTQEIKLTGLKKIFLNELNNNLYSPYNSTSNPIESYCMNLKLYRGYLEIEKVCENLSLEERYALGFYISPDELEFIQKNKIKVFKNIFNLY